MVHEGAAELCENLHKLRNLILLVTKLRDERRNEDGGGEGGTRPRQLRLERRNSALQFSNHIAECSQQPQHIDIVQQLYLQLFEPPFDKSKMSEVANADCSCSHCRQYTTGFDLQKMNCLKSNIKLFYALLPILHCYDFQADESFWYF